MLKKSLFLIVLAMVGAVSAWAQTGVGDWNVYPTFSEVVDDVIATPDKVYYLSTGTLYSYDKNTSETYIYTSRNKLNDSRIKRIDYNPAGNYLVIVYTNSNIDVLYDNGRVVNMSDLKDTNAVTDKTINDVGFGPDRIYLATNFGFVSFDDRNHRVVESGIYNERFVNITEVNGHIAAFVIGNASGLYLSPKDIKHNKFDKFNYAGGIWSTSNLQPLADGSLLNISGNDVYRCEIDYDKLTRRYVKTDLTGIDRFHTTADGFFVIKDKNTLLHYDDNFELQHTIAMPEPVKGYTTGMWDAKSVWFGGSKGICSYDLSGTAPVLTSDFFHPNAFTCVYPAYIKANRAGDHIYFTNLGPSHHMSGSNGDGYEMIQTTNKLYDDGTIEDVSVLEASTVDFGASLQTRLNTKRMVGGSDRVVEDPDDPDVYYIGNGVEGVYKVRGNEEIGHFTKANSPISSSWAIRVFDVNIDHEGNLWVGYETSVEGEVYAVLPAAKRRLDASTISKSDWVTIKTPISYEGNRDMGSLVCEKSPAVVMWQGGYNHGIVVLNTNGTITRPSDDKSIHFTKFIDQDGNKFSSTYYTCAIEDRNGRVWVGTATGIFEITNPAQAALDAEYVFNRIKVPRNDGTNFADYLLETDKINAISVDASNRKWIATEASGAYLVSENGDAILEHFTTDNSYLPSNTVYSVQCDPLSNRVYFGTPNGIASYNSTSAPSSPDYSDVYAYPNPVRPEFTGLITITGLMDNSLVKIADAAGNVFYQGRSEGGIVTWDGCNPAGERVRTGVYFVFASQGTPDGQSSGCVTKIMVVN